MQYNDTMYETQENSEIFCDNNTANLKRYGFAFQQTRSHL